MNAVNPAAPPFADELARGVYRLRLSPAAVNVIVIVDDGDALVVDTGTTADNARAITSVLDALGATLTGIVITHPHWDHVFGLAHLPAVPSYAHPLAIEDLATTGVIQRDHLVAWLGDAAPAELTTLEPRVPTHPVSAPTEVRMGGLRITLDPIGHAHAAGDLIVHVPERELTIVGDLIESDGPPQIDDANIASWLDALDHIERVAEATLVPGHGDPVGHEVIEQHRRLLR